MPIYNWVNLFDAGNWTIYVMYKGVDDSADSYTHYVRSDLLDSDIIEVDVVDGQIVVTVHDEADGSDTDLPQPSVVLRNTDGNYFLLRAAVTQNDTDVCPLWLSASQKVLDLDESSPGFLTPVGASVLSTLPYASRPAMATMREWDDPLSASYPYAMVEQLGDEAPPGVGATVAIAHNIAPFISVYQWNSVTGFGTKYANPASAIPGNGLSVSFHPSGAAIAVGSSRSATNEGIYAYQWSPAGFGTKYSAPNLPAPAATNYHLRGLSFSPAGNAIVGVHNQAPYFHGFPWSNVTGFGTRYADPSVNPTGSIGWRVKFRPQGDAIGTATYNAGLGQAYQFNATTGYGTRTQPATSSTSPRGVDFDPTGSTIAFTDTSTSPYIRAYPYNPSTGFGTAYSNPAAAAGSLGANQQPFDCTFSPAGDTLVASSGSGWAGSYPVSAYPWSNGSGFGTRYASPASNPLNSSNKQSVRFAPGGGAIIATDDVTPFVNAWVFAAGTGFGTRYSNPSSAITGLGYGVDSIGS